MVHKTKRAPRKLAEFETLLVIKNLTNKQTNKQTHPGTLPNLLKNSFN